MRNFNRYALLNFFTLLIFIMIVLELVFTTAHKTMGGSQFGNRYPNDVLPLVLLGIAFTAGEKSRWYKLSYVLLVLGMAINVIGSVLYYTK